jgi:hypothetical protein
MKKFTVMPQVVVYQDMFEEKDLYRFVELMKKYETPVDRSTAVSALESMLSDNHGENPHEKNDLSPINEWVPWHTFGLKNFYNDKIKPEGLNDPDLEFLYDFREKIYDAYAIAYKDYREEWAEKGEWPSYVTDWNLKITGKDSFSRSNDNLIAGTIEILKHDMKPDSEFALTFHTDTHENRLGEPQWKQTITFTCYINDNYEGGELQFINEKENKLITYKQKRGDVILFPSGSPYWHSALTVKSGEHKYFVRVFAVWNHPGTKEWHENAEKFGKEEWTRMFNEKIKKEVEEGLYDRIVVREGEIPNQSYNAKKIYVKKEDESYIDGRLL